MPYACVSSSTSPRTTLLMPGQRPPQVTIPQRSLAGSKKMRLRGPASSNVGSAEYPSATTREKRSSSNSRSARPTWCTAA